MSSMESIVRMFPLQLNRLGTVTSKIMKSTKLLADSSFVKFVPYRIPVNSTLPVVVVCTTMHSANLHNSSSVHGRTGAESIRYFVHSKWGKVRYE
jgi:hypothetical protein